jgi:hypothetical protein
VRRDLIPALRASGTAAALLAAGCGGGVPLLHGAHALSPGSTLTTAGFSGTFAAGSAREAIDAASTAPSSPAGAQLLADESAVRRALAPAVAPFVGMRVGVPGDNEVGLSFTGRLLRLDARHAFESGPFAFSLGAAGRWTWSAPAAERDSAPASSTSRAMAYGFDVPLLFGWRSDAGVISLWAGARGGLERIVDRASSSAAASTPLDLTHWHAGGVAGLAVGFRHVHVAVELETSYHGVRGNVGISDVTVTGVTLTPAGGLLFTF